MNDGLAQRRSLPPGGRTDYRVMADGARLRTMCWPALAPTQGSILFLNGRADFIEKYAESYWHWRARGYAVTAFDWRGQGLSGRFSNDPLLGDCPDFALWSADLAEMIAHVLASQPGPHFAVAHSMGGHLLLHQLTAMPHAFRRVVLLAPMVGINAGRRGLTLMRLWSRAMVLLGRGDTYAPGQRCNVARRRSQARRLLLTSDAARFDDEGWWTQREPGVAMGGVSNRWLAGAIASSGALLAEGVPESITTPVLMLLAGRERLVDNDQARRFGARLPHGDVETLAGAAHELLRERDSFRDVVLARIESFLHGQSTQSPPHERI